MADKTLEQQLEGHANAAVKAARKDLMAAWDLALRLGHRGGFHAWLAFVFNRLAAEAEQVHQSTPQSERVTHLHSPWNRT